LTRTTMFIALLGTLPLEVNARSWHYDVTGK
jgi:hypothetical protein